MPVEIKYNQVNDVEHYPIDQWHRDTIQRVHEFFQFPLTAEWIYDATIHGRIFWCECGRERVMADQIKELASINGFRWVEAKNGSLTIALMHHLPGSLTIALTHHLPQ